MAAVAAAVVVGGEEKEEEEEEFNCVHNAKNNSAIFQIYYLREVF
jgi:hypothetical protein